MRLFIFLWGLVMVPLGTYILFEPASLFHTTLGWAVIGIGLLDLLVSHPWK